MFKPPILLHIGYHKTATTWMQRLLFTPAHGYRQIADHADVFTNIVQPHGLRFDPADMKELIATRMAQVQPGEVPVILSEILSGHPFQGGHESDVYAERLKQIAPHARILISIRSQMKIIPSVYLQYILRGGTMPYTRFFEGAKELGYFGFTLQHFEYDLLVARYQALFGKENVFIQTQESLQHDMVATARALAEFSRNGVFTELSKSAQMVHAASYPEYAVPVLRRINHIQTSVLNPTPIVALGTTPYGLYKLAGYILRHPPFSTMLKGRKPVSDYTRSKFSGYFDNSNARLAKLSVYPLDLSEYP